MTNEKFIKVLQVLEAINEHFQEHDGQVILYSDAQILEGDKTIKEAVAEALKAMSNPNS